MVKTADIRDIDHQITAILQKDDFDAEEIAGLVDKREQILQNILNYIKENPSFAESDDWLSLVEQTKNIVLLLQSETTKVGSALKKYRYGNKSVQQYKKFL
ncbi:flagellar protein FliT [Vibrio sp. ZSDE26]|uniref:Flagellar protein FliT n=1 Tax=Vibrio amylolyticus TaxID=2847292 RepID=A0A9X1XMI8_9VIBR|nr:flagellar protein FliT [Vibrio amylolyticus]MCK6265471.1 flagellar protein FliT [Vibrio amylolyticus]